MRAPILAAVLALALPLAGCGALSSLSRASGALDAYTLAPLPVAPGRAGSSHLVVATPTATGALATDRILIKPSRVQAQYLPGARWSDAAPVLVQSLLVGSLQNAGGLRLVSRDPGGLVPDYELMTDLRDFQAESSASGAPVVRVGLMLTLIREADRQIVATRRVEATATAASDRTADVVAAFDQATTRALAEVADWIRGRAR